MWAVRNVVLECHLEHFLSSSMVSSYLVHHGYCATATAFARMTETPIQEEQASIKNRQSRSILFSPLLLSFTCPSLCSLAHTSLGTPSGVHSALVLTAGRPAQSHSPALGSASFPPSRQHCPGGQFGSMGMSCYSLPNVHSASLA